VDCTPPYPLEKGGQRKRSHTPVLFKLNLRKQGRKITLINLKRAKVKTMSNNNLLSFASACLALGPKGCPRLSEGAKKERKIKKGKNNYCYILIIVSSLVFIISCLFYLKKLTLFNNTSLNFILGIWYLFFVLALIYYLIGYIILKIKGKIEIDLSFIKIKYIISLFESIIFIKNSNDKFAIDILQKTINRHLIMYIFVFVLILIFIILELSLPHPPFS
jgi:hypothetical protein